MSQDQSGSQDSASSQPNAQMHPANDPLADGTEDGMPIPEELWGQLKSELEKRAEECQLFVKQFPDWRDQIRGYIKELQEIADSIDEYHRGATIASVTGVSAAIVGGTLSISGLFAAPFTLGTALGLSAVGAGMSATGAATNFTAGITENVTQTNRQKRVDKIIEQYNEHCKEMSGYLNEVCGAIKSWSHNLRVEILRHKSSEEMSDFLNEACSAAKCSGTDAAEDSVKVKPRTLPVSNAAEQATAVSQKTANIKELVSGSFPLLSTVARVISVILTAILLVTNIYSITKNSIDLNKGSKTEVAKKIRGVAVKMEDEITAYEDISEFLKLVVKID